MTVEVISHVPACWREPWQTLDVHPAHQAFFEVAQPWPIWVYAETPPELLEFTGPRAHIKQLELLAGAAFAVLEETRPRFYVSKVGGALVEARGSTILVTAYEASGRHVIGATWDAGEDVALALGRLAEIKRICKLDARVARTLLDCTPAEHLPPPQLVLSNVIPVGIDDGGSALGGYDARGASIPIAVIVMRKRTQFIFDHRLYNPPDECVFVECFGEHLRNRIAQEFPDGRGGNEEGP